MDATDLSQLDPNFLANLDRQNAQQQFLLEQLRRTQAIPHPTRYGVGGGIAQMGADILNAQNEQRMVQQAQKNLQLPGAGQTGLTFAQEQDALAQAQQRSMQAQKLRDELEAYKDPAVQRAYGAAAQAVEAPADAMQGVNPRFAPHILDIYKDAYTARVRAREMALIAQMRWGMPSVKTLPDGRNYYIFHDGSMFEQGPNGEIGKMISGPTGGAGPMLPRTLGGPGASAPSGANGTPNGGYALTSGQTNPQAAAEAYADDLIKKGVLPAEKRAEAIQNALASMGGNTVTTSYNHSPEPEVQGDRALPNANPGYMDVGAGQGLNIPEPAAPPPFVNAPYNKFSTQFGKIFSIDRGSTGLSSIKKRLNAVDYLNAVLLDPQTHQEITDLSRINSNEVASAAAGLIGGGNKPAITAIHDIAPNTIGLDLARLEEYVSGHPELVHMPGFVHAFADIAKREGDTLNQQAQEAFQRDLASNAPFLERNFSQAQAQARTAGFDLSRKWDPKVGQYHYTITALKPLNVNNRAAIPVVKSVEEARRLPKGTRFRVDPSDPYAGGQEFTR